MPQLPLVRPTRLEPDQALPASEGVRRTRHRLDGEAVSGDVRQRVAGEDHHVRIALVDPERRHVAQTNPGASVAVALEVGEAVVELDRSDRLRRPEVEVRSLDRSSVDWDRALIGDQRRPGGNVQLELVHEAFAGREVRVGADPVRTRLRTDVRRLHAHCQAVLAERILDAESRARTGSPASGGAGARASARSSSVARRPTTATSGRARGSRSAARARRARAEGADPRIRSVPSSIRFGQGASSWPRPEAHISSTAVAVEERPPADGVAAQAAADADDDRPLLAERKLHLLARRADRRVHASEDLPDSRPLGFIPIGRCGCEARFLALSLHEPARVDGC